MHKRLTEMRKQTIQDMNRTQNQIVNGKSFYLSLVETMIIRTVMMKVAVVVVGSE